MVPSAINEFPERHHCRKLITWELVLSVYRFPVPLVTEPNFTSNHHLTMSCFNQGFGSLIVDVGLPNVEMLADSCLMQSYLGTFGGHSIYVPSLPRVSLIPTDTTELVIVYQNAIENKEDEANAQIEGDGCCSCC